MDMLNILRNLDAVEKGEKPAATKGSANEMKSILESFYRVNEAEQVVDECGMDMPAPAPQEDKVTMNVNLNARGVDAIEELITLMGGKKEAHVEPDGDEMPMALPVPKDSHDDMAKLMAIASAEHGDEPEEEDVGEEWDNAPDEEYSDMSDAVPSGDDLHKQKKMYAKAGDGDNAMAVESIKERLWAALTEKQKK